MAISPSHLRADTSRWPSRTRGNRACWSVAALAPMAKMEGWVHYWDDPDHVLQLYVGIGVAVGLLAFFVIYAKVTAKKPKS